MCIDIKEIERIKRLKIGKKCDHCKVGYYQYFSKKQNLVRCINCAEKPFKNYYL